MNTTGLTVRFTPFTFLPNKTSLTLHPNATVTVVDNGVTICKSSAWQGRWGWWLNSDKHIQLWCNDGYWFTTNGFFLRFWKSDGAYWQWNHQRVKSWEQECQPNGCESLRIPWNVYYYCDRRDRRERKERKGRRTGSNNHLRDSEASQVID